MRLPTTKSTKDEQKAAILEKHKANEKTYSLVVKIISWKTGIFDINNTQASKITPTEWDTYRKHILNISKAESVEKVKSKLHETQVAIKKHGGFK